MAKVILITGISSGFGKETARLLSENGFLVYGTVRRDCEISSIVNVLKVDLTNNKSIEEAVKIVVDREGRIDVLINNAGMHTGGPIETTPEENIRLQMDTNFLGMVHLTRMVLPVMRRQGGGLIINISSIGGLMGLPFQAFYSASKFAIEGFSEALRIEVKEFNIKVVIINPGDFRTSNSANRRNYLAPTGYDKSYEDLFGRALSVMEKDEASGWDPVVLATKILKIVRSRNPRQRYIVASPEQKLAVVLKRILPDRIFMKILGSHY